MEHVSTLGSNHGSMVQAHLGQTSCQSRKEALGLEVRELEMCHLAPIFKLPLLPMLPWLCATRNGVS